MSFKGKNTPKMELFRTDQYYIFVNGEYSLWWDRTTGEFEAKSGNIRVEPLPPFMSHGMTQI
jgi:hypothetical protein